MVKNPPWGRRQSDMTSNLACSAGAVGKFLQPSGDNGVGKKVKVKVAQSSPTLCNLMDYTVHGILQARILEWVAISFSRESSQPRDQIWSSALQADSLLSKPPRKPRNTFSSVQSLSRVRLSVTP